MNYRKSDYEDICSLEYVFTNILNLDVEYKKNVRCYSNQETLCQLFFHCKSCSSHDDIDQIVTSSIFTSDYISILISSYEGIKQHTNNLTTISDGDIRILLAILLGNKTDEFKTSYSQLLTKGFERNSKRKSQDNNIRIILSNIDFLKLSTYIDSLIAGMNSAAKEKEIILYIDNILSRNEKLSNLCERFNLTQDSHTLALILLYSLFSDENFDIYITNNFVMHSGFDENSDQSEDTDSHETVSDSGQSQTVKDDDAESTISDDKNKLFADNFYQRHISLFIKMLTYLLVLVSALQFISLCYPFVSSEHWTNYSNSSFALYSIVLLSVSSVLLVFRYFSFIFTRKSVRHTILKTSNIEYEISFQDYTLKHRRLMEQRILIYIIVTLLIIIAIGISVIADSFPLLVALIMMVSIMFIYVDSVSENIYCARFYDKISQSGNEKPMYKRGLAKLFIGDFDFTKNAFTDKTFTGQEFHSDECISYIYNMLAERLNNTWIVTNVILILMNLTTLVLCIVHFIYPLNSYFRIYNKMFFDYCSIILILATGILNIILLLYSNTHYKNILIFKHLSQALHFRSETSNELLNYFYHMSLVKDIDIARGIYCYNYSMFEKNVMIEEIANTDRLHFSHRRILRNNRLHICSVLSILTIVCIMSWHFKFYMLLFIMPFLIIIIPFLTNIIVDKLDVRMMKKLVISYSDDCSQEADSKCEM